MVIGVGGPTFRVTTKSALYWVGALARGSLVSSAGAVNAGRMETKANNPADISLFMIRSYYDPTSSARNKKRSSVGRGSRTVEGSIGATGAGLPENVAIPITCRAESPRRPRLGARQGLATLSRKSFLISPACIPDRSGASPYRTPFFRPHHRAR